MRTVCLLAACLVSALADEADPHSEVHVLTNSNFERNTQASTGSTTGNFFVKFYAPWCGHCKALAPTWESLAAEKDPPVRNTIFAKVDCTGNGDKVCSRFKVRGFPTLHLFAKGNMYEYNGQRDSDSLRAFAEGGYEDAEGKKVPPVPTVMSKFIDSMKEDIDHIVDKRKNAAVALILVGVVIGLILGNLVCGHQGKAKSE